MSENVIEVEVRWDCPFLPPWDGRYECKHENGPTLCGVQAHPIDTIPADCPLRKGPVIVKLKEADHE